MLELKNITAGYGDVTVLNDVSLDVSEGEIAAIIGANAAGKSTLLKAVSGIIKPGGGEILFAGKRIDAMTAVEIVEQGIIHVPEGRRLFSYMTVEENLEMGAYNQRSRKRAAMNKEKVFAVFPILRDRRGQFAGSLSGGEQQMCAIGRGMMAEPELLMLDEPSLGLAPIIVKQLFEIIRGINKMGTTILLVEQNANLSLRLATRAWVLENGRIAIEGSSRDLMNDANVRKAYLGIANIKDM
jgi:branched-chain amino acid transport system ATP-binding protein